MGAVCDTSARRMVWVRSGKYLFRRLFSISSNVSLMPMVVAFGRISLSVDIGSATVRSALVVGWMDLLC